MFVSASDIENGKTVYFSNLYPKMKLPGPEYPAVHFGVEHPMASGSFPGGFPWTVIYGRSCWDGGLTDNTPLHPVIDSLTAEAETMFDLRDRCQHWRWVGNIASGEERQPAEQPDHEQIEEAKEHECRG